MTWPDLMAQKPHVPDPLVVPDRKDDEKYQMPFKMTVSDKKLLRAKADAAGQSPTRWLIERIRSDPARGGKSAGVDAIVNGISFLLDARRRRFADAVAKQLGFHQAEHLAKDLLYRAIEDPAAAEEFLFGNLREQSDAEQQEPPEQTKSPSKSRRASAA